MKENIKIICPDCKNELRVEAAQMYCRGGHRFQRKDGLFDLLPISISEITKKDAEFHGGRIENIVDQAQYDSLRNRLTHKEITDFIAKRSTCNSNILEIGGGYGYDLGVFLAGEPAFGHYIFSDISCNMLSYVRAKTANDRVHYFAIDANNIPFGDGQFDFVYTIAALHHFCDLDRSLKEMIRITKKDGFIIFGIEPNRWWLRLFASSRGVLRKIMPAKDHSPSDDEAAGFTAASFKAIARAYDLKLVKLDRVWFLSGFLHFGLEFLFRMFKLKNRIKLPYLVELPVIQLDRLLSVVPVLKNSCWHYTAVYQKK